MAIAVKNEKETEGRETSRLGKQKVRKRSGKYCYSGVYVQSPSGRERVSREKSRSSCFSDLTASSYSTIHASLFHLSVESITSFTALGFLWYTACSHGVAPLSLSWEEKKEWEKNYWSQRYIATTVGVNKLSSFHPSTPLLGLS